MDVDCSVTLKETAGNISGGVVLCSSYFLLPEVSVAASRGMQICVESPESVEQLSDTHQRHGGRSCSAVWQLLCAHVPAV